LAKILALRQKLFFDDQAQHSVMGEVITVNGVPWPRMEVANRKYRFRVLNASISRSYRLALSTADDMIVIGTDDGLMPRPMSTID
jgi:spore coat protein A, manganese oxidase